MFSKPKPQPKPQAPRHPARKVMPSWNLLTAAPGRYKPAASHLAPAGKKELF